MIRSRETTDPSVGIFAEPEKAFITDFSRALRPRTMETGKTIEREARRSLSLLNNFCVLKFNRAPYRDGDTFVVHVVGRGDTISALELKIRPNVELPLPRTPIVFDGTNDREAITSCGLITRRPTRTSTRKSRVSSSRNFSFSESFIRD